LALIRWTARSLRHLELIHAWILQDSGLQADRIVEILGVYHGRMEIESRIAPPP
jgi:plasmid stabilization system protein ParE